MCYLDSAEAAGSGNYQLAAGSGTGLTVLRVRELLDVVAQHLLRAGVAPQAVSLYTADIEARVGWLGECWPWEGLCAPLLEIAREEAAFHEPEELDWRYRAAAVLCVRNSRLDELCRKGPGVKLTTEAIVALTTEVAEPLATYLQSVEATDLMPVNPFSSLCLQYPTTWDALERLGSGELQASESSIDPRPRPRELTATHQGGGFSLTRVEREKMDSVSQYLGGSFCVPSFSDVSRNTEKMFEIIEHYLKSGWKVVTPNYLIAKSSVERRAELRQPPNSEWTEPLFAWWFDVSGISDDHRAELEVWAAKATGIAEAMVHQLCDDMTREGCEKAVADGIARQVEAKRRRGVGRNDPCYCGSSKKLKNCHG